MSGYQGNDDAASQPSNGTGRAGNSTNHQQGQQQGVPAQSAATFGRGRAMAVQPRGRASAPPNHVAAARSIGTIAGPSGTQPTGRGGHNPQGIPAARTLGRGRGRASTPPAYLPNTVAPAPLGYGAPPPAAFAPAGHGQTLLAPAALPPGALPADGRYKAFAPPPGSTVNSGTGSTRVYTTQDFGPLRAPGHACSDT